MQLASDIADSMTGPVFLADTVQSSSASLAAIQTNIHQAPSGDEWDAQHQQQMRKHSGNQDEIQNTALVTEFANLTESPVQRSSARFSSTETSPVDSAPFMSDLARGPRTGSLKTQLDQAFQKSPYDRNTSFLPRDMLESIIDEDNVAEYCSTYAASDLAVLTPKVIAYVFDHQNHSRGFARQVFSVLVLMDEPSLIPGVVEENIRDHDLPLAQCDQEGTEFQLARKGNMLIDPIKCFRNWKGSQRRYFDVVQFQVKAPVFKSLDRNFGPPPRRTRSHNQRGTNNHQADDYITETLDSRTVLPFTSFNGKCQIIGGTSKVVRVKIHPAHHEFNQRENEYFALKTLEARDTRSQTHFCLEVKALLKIRAKEKPHLVEVLTTFKHDNKYHLLFRWASGGNLSDFWNRPRGSDTTSSYESVCWLAQQCWGIADGLDGIHNAKLSLDEIKEVEPSIIPPEHAILTGRPPLNSSKSDNKDCGRHGDIKPPNILWFKQDENKYDHGCLKISDFGLTTFHTEWTTKISPQKETFFELTYTYAAPEWDLKEDVSRPFDIWSLGCVYLEFMTWQLCGSNGIKEFRKNRSGEKGSRKNFISDVFYALEGSGDKRQAIVKTSVVEWTQYLKKLPQCSQYMAVFLDYIVASMVVVDKNKRHSSSVVRRSLSDMFRQCEENRVYALEHRVPATIPIRRTEPESPIESQDDVTREANKEVSKVSRWKQLCCLSG